MAVNLPNRALIYHNGIPVAVCPAEEFGAEGLRVHCGPLSYERDTLLEVALDLGPGAPRNLRVPVQVADCTPDEMALHYRELPPEAEAALSGFPPSRS